MKVRDSTVDFIKGVSIIAMVVGHSCMYQAPDVFVNLFHMSCFLMASGFFVKRDVFSDWAGAWRWMKGKVVRLYWPFALWTVLFIGLQNALIWANVYTDNPQMLEVVKSDLVYLVHPLTVKNAVGRIIGAVFFQGGTVLTGPLWFLRTLFFVCIAYASSSWMMSRIRLNPVIGQSFIAAAFLWGGKYVSFPVLDYIGGPCFFAAYALFQLGFVFKYLCDKEKFRRCYESNVVGSMAVVVLVVVYKLGFLVILAQNAYKSGFVVALCGVCGWLSLRMTYRILSQMNAWLVIRGIVYVGQHTMPILIFHLLAFRIVNYIVVPCRDLPWCCVAAESNLIVSYGGKLVYVAIGVVIPLVMQFLFDHVSARIKSYCS